MEHGRANRQHSEEPVPPPGVAINLGIVAVYATNVDGGQGHSTLTRVAVFRILPHGPPSRCSETAALREIEICSLYHKPKKHRRYHDLRMVGQAHPTDFVQIPLTS